MLETKYDHKKVEEGKYEFWKQNDYFKSGDLTKEPFCIVIPPPNVTGKLHLGHAWDATLQDIIIRYKRMDGFDTLWVPGMDHAGIATQAKVDKKLKSMGFKPREMDRDEWLKYAWDWKKEYASNIHEQWATLGLSLDYSKERFTLDEGLNKAVTKVFIDYYNKGLIYRGERIINWDPEAQTALSNEEVIYKDTKSAFYHIKYVFEDSDEYLEVATTRPETLFGDTAVAVNPDDKRYKKYVGKNVILPILNKKIPVIADIHADPEFGTGVVKITPAHDPNDFEVGNRHNLERIICINPDGTMNKNAGKYEGLTREDAREKVVAELKEDGLLLRVEPITHSVGYSERTDVMVEPYLSKQWFVKMDKLAQQVLDNQKTKDNNVNFIPPRMEKILNHWMSDCHDWCISRQLWWGHRIPAWYKDDEVKVQVECPGKGWIQDQDVLDTWFSSALWPFSTLGWPNETADFKRYFPTDVLVTGYDIIFFWVARMMFQSLELTSKRPFKQTVIHGLIRDSQGRKMSKSLGNGVDPMDVIDKYGADALRYFLATSSAPGMDMRFDDDKVAATWNFINKLWNASRFTLMNLENWDTVTFDNLSVSDKWILDKLNTTVKNVRKHMDKYEFNVVGSEIYSFVWDDFCDWYIELAKINMNDTTKSVLEYVLTNILQMLHPFMPFVTEEIYQKLPHHEESIMISAYPKYRKDLKFNNTFDNITSLITSIRKNKLEKNIKEFTILTDNQYVIDNKTVIIRMTKALDIVQKSDKSLDKIDISFETDKVTLLFDNSSNLANEKEELLKEKDRLENSIKHRKALLANQGYINKAPKAIVDQEKENLTKEEAALSLINNKL
jgi:valyl-tRNA synthetase